MEMHIESLQQLRAMGFQFEDNSPRVINHLDQLIRERELSIVEIANIVGVSRQTIDSFVSNRSSPNLQLGLKIAHIFGMKVEDIFYLTDMAWVETAKDDEKRTMYFDRLTYRVLSGLDMKDYDKFEHVHLATGETVPLPLFKEKQKATEEEAVTQHLERNPTKNKRDELAKVKEEARKEWEAKCPARFEVLYRRVEPVILPN